MTRTGLALTLAAVLGTPAAAQTAHAPRQADDAAGAWHVTVDRPSGANPRLAAMIAQLTQVMDVFRREPALARPRGFTVLAQIRVHQTAPTRMVGGSLRTLLINNAMNGNGSTDTSGAGEGLGFSVTANNIGCTFGAKTELSDAAGQIYAAVAPSAWHGFPMYGDDACIVVTRRAAQPTVPVTRERAMRAAISFFASAPSVAGALERELAALSAVDRAAPAYLDMDAFVAYTTERKVSRPLFVGAEGSTVLRLVAPNPAFYDRARAGDIQVLTVEFDCGGSHDSPWCAQYPGLFERIRDDLDWPALSALVR